MNEVEKLYENCNIKPKQKGYCDWDSNCPYPHHKCNDECPYWKYENIVQYPPFTVEKQLELIKWLIRNERLFIRKADYSSNYYMDVTYNRGNGVDNPKFESCLASLVNDIWQELTEEERKQIKEILE